jgi:hypothetical protein
MSTTGYKRRRAEFQDLIYQNLRRVGSQSSDTGSILPSGAQIGLGVKTGAIYRIGEQGSLSQTENRFDLAVLYRTRFPGQPVSLCGAPEGLVVPGGAHGVWAAVSVLLDQPLGVVAGDEGADGVSDLVDGLEDASVHHLLFQGAEEALDDAVRLRLADEGVARRFWKASGMKALPWSWRSARPRAAPAPRWPNRWRSAMPTAWMAS